MQSKEGPGLPGRLKKRFVGLSLKSKRRLAAAAVFVVLVAIMSLEISPVGFVLDAGDRSPRTIRAPRTVQFTDEEKTEEARDAAASAVQEVTVFDGAVKNKVVSKLEEFFSVLDGVAALPNSEDEKSDMVYERTGTRLPAAAVKSLLSLPESYREEVRRAVLDVAGMVMDERISEENIDAARATARKLVGDTSLDFSAQELALGILTEFLQPNTVVDEEETRKRRKAARQGIRPVITTLLEGEVIVGKGEVVTPEQVELLRLLGFTGPVFSIDETLYVAVFVMAVMGIVSMFFAMKRKALYDNPSMLLLLGSIIVIYAALAKVLAVAASTWSSLWGFLAPTAAVAFITAVLADTMVAVLMVVVCALVTTVVSHGNISVTSFALLGGLLPAVLVSRSSNRHKLRRAGLFTGFWLAFVALSVSLVTAVRQDVLLNVGAALLNGAICGIVAMGTLPFLETTLGIPTNTWLLELGSSEQDLLKELSVRAPGTYSHSVMVANLAEAAASKVGSDPMLARVAAYYHDVGKMKRPQFFVENQVAGHNPHANLNPSLSALIITNHVKEGVDMLERYHVPPELVQIVKEHHGTSIVRFFYERALEAEGPGVEESRFRYRFEKPRSKTAGILMLADAVEATARTLGQPSTAMIENTVLRVIGDKLEDGQLDECELTLGDLNNVKRTFIKILNSAYHPRVDYPLMRSKKGVSHAVESEDTGGPAGVGRHVAVTAKDAQEDVAKAGGRSRHRTQRGTGR